MCTLPSTRKNGCANWKILRWIFIYWLHTAMTLFARHFFQRNFPLEFSPFSRNLAKLAELDKILKLNLRRRRRKSTPFSTHFFRWHGERMQPPKNTSQIFKRSFFRISIMRFRAKSRANTKKGIRDGFFKLMKFRILLIKYLFSNFIVVVSSLI